MEPTSCTDQRRLAYDHAARSNYIATGYRPAASIASNRVAIGNYAAALVPSTVASNPIANLVGVLGGRGRSIYLRNVPFGW